MSFSIIRNMSHWLLWHVSNNEDFIRLLYTYCYTITLPRLIHSTGLTECRGSKQHIWEKRCEPTSKWQEVEKAPRGFSMYTRSHTHRVRVRLFTDKHGTGVFWYFRLPGFSVGFFIWLCSGVYQPTSLIHEIYRLCMKTYLKVTV